MKKAVLSKNIVFLLNHMDYGGCQKIVYDLILGVYKSFDTIYLISREGHYSNILVDSRSIIFVDRANYPKYKLVKKIKEIQKSHHKIILHTHNRIDIIFKCVLRKTDSHVHTFHSAYLNKNFFYKFIKPEKSISISSTVHRYLNKYNVDNVMIYNGINLLDSRVYSREKELKTPKILYIGRLSKEKGFENLLKALLSYKDNIFINLEFDVLGDGVDIDKYKMMAMSSKTNVKVNFRGYTSNPWDNINDFDLLIIPSFFEGFCLVAAEGASLGIPIIGNNISALREVLNFLPDSNFFDINDLDSVIRTISSSLSNITKQRLIAANNRTSVRHKFSSSSMITNYLEVYESCN